MCIRDSNETYLVKKNKETSSKKMSDMSRDIYRNITSSIFMLCLIHFFTNLRTQDSLAKIACKECQGRASLKQITKAHVLQQSTVMKFTVRTTLAVIYPLSAYPSRNIIPEKILNLA